MGAVYKRELKAYTRNLYAFLFAAVILAVLGASMFYFNLNYRLAKLAYAWSNGYTEYALILMIPILCMRSMATDRRQGMDEFYRSLPISTTSVVLGKYFALLTVYAAPLAVACLYPLLLSSFGKISWGWSYLILLMYFLLGAALIALCMFLSSLTHYPLVAAAMGFSVCLALFFLPILLGILPASPLLSLILLAALGVLLAAVCFLSTKNILVTAITAVVSIGSISVCYLIDTLKKGTAFEALFSFSLQQAIPFYQYEYVAQKGFLDLFSVFMLLAFAAFFVVLSILTVKARADR
ncbi:MAG: hypothetical protein J6D87_05680 [Clostridia bacterium]|nr:hypothetical protein [Clostridia bacterium]